MFDFSGDIRLSIKAIIIKEDEILLTYNEYRGETFYLLPGGGQKHGERIDEALKRECIEETGYHVSVGKLVFVRDYIGKNHQFSDEDQDIHQVELMFICKLSGGSLDLAEIEDSYQVGVKWVPLEELKKINIYPNVLKNVIHSDGKLESKIYLGDTN